MTCNHGEEKPITILEYHTEKNCYKLYGQVKNSSESRTCCLNWFQDATE